MAKGTLILKQGDEVLADKLTLKQAKAEAMMLARATLVKYEVWNEKGKKVAAAKTIVQWEEK